MTNTKSPRSEVVLRSMYGLTVRAYPMGPGYRVLWEGGRDDFTRDLMGYCLKNSLSEENTLRFCLTGVRL